MVLYPRCSYKFFSYLPGSSLSTGYYRRSVVGMGSRVCGNEIGKTPPTAKKTHQGDSQIIYDDSSGVTNNLISRHAGVFSCTGAKANQIQVEAFSCREQMCMHADHIFCRNMGRTLFLSLRPYGFFRIFCNNIHNR